MNTSNATIYHCNHYSKYTHTHTYIYVAIQLLQVRERRKYLGSKMIRNKNKQNTELILLSNKLENSKSLRGWQK
jgi:hypothetical protein